jgi:hypothetical protein
MSEIAATESFEKFIQGTLRRSREILRILVTDATLDPETRKMIDLCKVTVSNTNAAKGGESKTDMSEEAAESLENVQE